MEPVGPMVTVSGTSAHGPTAGSAHEGVTTTGVNVESVTYTNSASCSLQRGTWWH